MKYNLVIQSNNKLIEITGYSHLEEYSHICETSLDGIVAFTSCFENESELKEFLRSKNLLPQDGDIRIAFYRGKTTKPIVLRFEPVYKNDFKLLDIKKITDYFNKNITNDIFMKKFIEEFYDRFKNTPLEKFLYEIIYSYKYYKANDFFPINADANFNRFINTFCRKKNGTIRYSNLIELAKFASKIQEEQKNLKEQQMNDIALELLHFQTLLNNDEIDDEARSSYEKGILDNTETLDEYAFLTRKKGK